MSKNLTITASLNLEFLCNGYAEPELTSCSIFKNSRLRRCYPFLSVVALTAERLRRLISSQPPQPPPKSG
ncbi:hypothetical protein H6G80_29915 [Nostoc sp. FACHB-87]|uniref:hypothetical protein n=1 Tax=Nostoc sp. FACHB-87 TaxID=2692841 RepID=UPI0016874E2B|nr:hypothetical protein [Nostoc sp. FACHB-87]MBD2458270.1 hypothetical protein [Nostoc sp. FACHB-87]